jgi:hypothetical protein
LYCITVIDPATGAAGLPHAPILEATAQQPNEGQP